MSQPADRPPAVASAVPAAGLGLWDVVSIIVGIVVGTGIYETPPLVLRQVGGPAQALGVWAVCGLLALVGALCYAELASAYPRSGGDYVYLGRAFGPWLGFLFGWAQLAVILTGSIGMMAYVFADYAGRLWGLSITNRAACAAAAVAALTLLNLLGVVFGKATQNLLTVAKVVGLGGILVAGFGWPAPPAPLVSAATAVGMSVGATTPAGGAMAAVTAAIPPAAAGSLAFALVLVFVTYGGWNDAAYVAAEVRDGARNIPRALLLGTGAVTVLYVLVNAAYLWALGFDAARSSGAIAADVLKGPLGVAGERAMCVLVMVSALGAVNGLIFSGARVYSTMGADHPVFTWLGRWSSGRKAPVGALTAQAAISLGMIAVVGTPGGQGLVSSLLTGLGGGRLEWEGHGGFETLLKCTAPVFWLFFLLTGLSLFVLRERDPGLPRPFRVPLYPYLPLVFFATCAYMLHSSIGYAGMHGLVGGLLLLLGLPLYEVSRRLARRAAPEGPGGPRPPVPAPGADTAPRESVYRPV
jgi:amino acid transporter